MKHNVLAAGAPLAGHLERVIGDAERDSRPGFLAIVRGPDLLRLGDMLTALTVQMSVTLCERPHALQAWMVSVNIGLDFPLNQARFKQVMSATMYGCGGLPAAVLDDQRALTARRTIKALSVHGIDGILRPVANGMVRRRHAIQALIEAGQKDEAAQVEGGYGTTEEREAAIQATYERYKFSPRHGFAPLS